MASSIPTRSDAPVADRDLLDLAVRLTLSHRLDPAFVASAATISTCDFAAAADGKSVALAPVQRERMTRVVNVLIRLEVRLLGDSRAMDHALTTPMDVIADSTLVQAMTGSMDQLRSARLATDHVAVPEVRWWRVGHR